MGGGAVLFHNAPQRGRFLQLEDTRDDSCGLPELSLLLAGGGGGKSHHVRFLFPCTRCRVLFTFLFSSLLFFFSFSNTFPGFSELFRENFGTFGIFLGTRYRLPTGLRRGWIL